MDEIDIEDVDLTGADITGTPLEELRKDIATNRAAKSS
jgi:hypothetical protein